VCLYLFGDIVVEVEIGSNLAHTLRVMAVVVIVALALYITKNPWCLLGLMFVS
jgi:hypothetical protein